METFGDRIKELRIAAGLSQKALAEWLNISVKTVCRYEKEQHPSIQVLSLFALYFNVSTDYLLGLKSYKEMMEEREKKMIGSSFYRHYLKCLNDYTLTAGAVYYWIYMKGKEYGGQMQWVGWADEKRRYEIFRLCPVNPINAIAWCTEINGKPMVLNSEADVKIYWIYRGDAIVREDICREYLPDFLEDYVKKAITF